MRASHEFPPVFDENSEILILGSFPSVKSRQESFFYANPQNRFWKLMAQLLNESTPKDTKDKIAMLKKTIWSKNPLIVIHLLCVFLIFYSSHSFCS